MHVYARTCIREIIVSDLEVPEGEDDRRLKHVRDVQNVERYDDRVDEAVVGAVTSDKNTNNIQHGLHQRGSRDY